MHFGLKESEAVIVWTDPRETSDEDAQLLAKRLLLGDEKRKFSSAQDQRDYIAARSLVRLGLSSCFSVAPEEWRFVRDERGKPTAILPAGLPPFEFSLSHTRGLIALLITFATEAGVDVEHMERTNDLELVAQRVCSRSELASLRQISGEEWRERFFQFWTLKEAYAKGRGLGLALPLQSVSFTLGDEQKVTSEDAPDWQFHLTKLSPDHMLAAAVRIQINQDFEFRIRKIRLTSGYFLH